MKSTVFTREQLAESQTYHDCKDLLLAVLEEEKTYTKQEAEEAMMAYRLGERKEK